jgi:hypothetical protein
MIFEHAAVSKGRPPRPRDLWGQVRHPAEPTCADWSFSSLLNGARFENDGASGDSC